MRWRSFCNPRLLGALGLEALGAQPLYPAPPPLQVGSARLRRTAAPGAIAQPRRRRRQLLSSRTLEEL